MLIAVAHHAVKLKCGAAEILCRGPLALMGADVCRPHHGLAVHSGRMYCPAVHAALRDSEDFRRGATPRDAATVDVLECHSREGRKPLVFSNS